MELPWQFPVDLHQLWTQFLTCGFGFLLGVGILMLVDLFQWPKWLADTKRGRNDEHGTG